MKEKSFQAIAAMSENRVIGRGNQLPWRLPADFRWFKEKTTGHTVVMGRKTFESLGKPLPNRATIVMSRSGFSYPGVRTVGALEAIDPAREQGDVFICGGSEVYAQALPLCSDLFLTHVKRTVDGDAFFPPFEDRFRLSAILQDNADFRVCHYRCVESAGDSNRSLPPPI